MYYLIFPCWNNLNAVRLFKIVLSVFKRQSFCQMWVEWLMKLPDKNSLVNNNWVCIMKAFSFYSFDWNVLAFSFAFLWCFGISYKDILFSTLQEYINMSQVKRKIHFLWLSFHSNSQRQSFYYKCIAYLNWGTLLI